MEQAEFKKQCYSILLTRHFVRTIFHLSVTSYLKLKQIYVKTGHNNFFLAVLSNENSRVRLTASITRCHNVSPTGHFVKTTFHLPVLSYHKLEQKGNLELNNFTLTVLSNGTSKVRLTAMLTRCHVILLTGHFVKTTFLSYWKLEQNKEGRTR